MQLMPNRNAKYCRMKSQNKRTFIWIKYTSLILLIDQLKTRNKYFYIKKHFIYDWYSCLKFLKGIETRVWKHLCVHKIEISKAPIFFSLNSSMNGARKSWTMVKCVKYYIF